jgi:hypothetical protein
VGVIVNQNFDKGIRTEGPRDKGSLHLSATWRGALTVLSYS